MRTPASLSQYIGQSEYYIHRHLDHLDRHGGSPAPPPYYLGFGLKYAERFRHGIAPRLSPDGQRWVDRTLPALQECIESAIRHNASDFADLELNTSRFNAFIFATHVDVYRASGVAELPLHDLRHVGLAVGLLDLLRQPRAIGGWLEVSARVIQRRTLGRRVIQRRPLRSNSSSERA